MPSFNYDFPYGSRKLPVFASNVVASSQHLAATAGLRMLAKGGNAVDAAVASAIAITVVEPTMNGIGADAFCILWDGSKLVGLNASGHSPALMTPDQYKGQDKMPSTGWGSVSVSGRMGEIAGSGLFDLSTLFGKSDANNRQFLQVPRFVARIDALAAAKKK